MENNTKQIIRNKTNNTKQNKKMKYNAHLIQIIPVQT